MKKILILQANPNQQSFCESLARTYEKAASGVGHKVEYCDVATLKFDYNLMPDSSLEPDLKNQRKLISWADEVVIVAPVWWLGFPACLKAYFDRVLGGGFAFQYPHPNPILRKFKPEPLLKGKKLRLISTQDSPRGIYWLLGQPFQWAYRFAIFNYCGFKYNRTAFCSVRLASDSKKSKWLNKVTNLAQKS